MKNFSALKNCNFRVIDGSLITEENSYIYGLADKLMAASILQTNNKIP